MDLQLSYVNLTWPEMFGTYGVLLAVSLVCGWLFFYKFGQLLLSLVLPAFQKHELAWPLALFTGLWAFPTLVLFAGLLGTFSISFLLFYGVAILGGCWYQRIALLPRLRIDRWLRAEPFAVGSCAVATLLLAFIGVAHLTPWFDGNFVTAGGHLARTGLYLVAQSDGQPGMVTLTALVNVFFPTLSPLVASVGWGALEAPVLFFGMFFAVRELFGRRWESLAVLIFLFPMAFKLQEIRGSLSGLVLLTWTLVFILRLFRTGERAELLGAVVTLSAAWNFGQLGALYFFALIGIWSIHEYLRGERTHALQLWQLLVWTNLIEWPHLLISFSWAMGTAAPLWKAFVPGTASLLLALAVVRLLPQLPEVRVSARWFLVPLLLVVGLAYSENTIGDPRYNWFFFSERTDFVFLNFGLYGLLGWLFALALLLGLGAQLSGRESPGGTVVWLGFFVSCLMQWLSAVLVRHGTFPLGEPAGAWDLWKDTTLYWVNMFMVLGVVYLLQRVAALGASVERLFTAARLRMLAVAAMVLCLQGLEPYRALAQDAPSLGEKVGQVMNAHLAPYSNVTWMGQQLYSFPMYAYYALNNDGMARRPMRRIDCPRCSVHSLEFMNAQWPLFDFLAALPLAPGDRFATSDSVMTYEMYVNRQVRYASGANTVSPMYRSDLALVTSYQWYWKPQNYIRRTRNGIAYAIVNPSENLTWLDTTATADGRLSASLTVKTSGEYEIYRGDETNPDLAAADVDGAPLTPAPGSPALGWARLEAGHTYTLTFSPLDATRPLLAAVPVVVYPRRYWDYEQLLFDDSIPSFGQLGVMRSTGMPSAELTIEDMQTLLRDGTNLLRATLLVRYHLRVIVLDPLLRLAFPSADDILAGDPALDRHIVNGTPVYVVRR